MVEKQRKRNKMQFRTLEALQEHNAKVRALKKEQNKEKKSRNGFHA